ncbi:protein phosphatase 1 regulatory subunit 36 [Grus americana]|uniref:protein phosphatase 1 regulatory subunit 36 n=1 Tax=Grus americana TaxID=9117 RepID=UPI0024083733|nr:protein phosphatase 1 regulatory subunit 36 [Grus americana]
MEDRDLTQQEETRGRKEVNDWMTIKLTPGVWYWKDDTNTLEFASSNPAAEDNLKEGKNTHFQEMRVKTLKSIFQDDCSAALPERRLADKERKLHRLSKWVQHEYVTLDDVKYAALLLKEANESHYMLSFAEVMRNKKLDEFLMALLFYLSFYLEKIALEKKCRSLILTMIFLEKKEMDDVLAKLAVARIHLAKVYSHLILERGMAQQHRMPSGSLRRKTSLQKDRSFFEGFYNFCSHVAWLVFRRKHFQVIREEIGRLLCSNVFNPALRDRSNVDLQKAGDRTADANTIRLPYLRKVRAKHPSINSMVHQRSPALSTLLPLPKDRAQYLSQNHYRQGTDSQPCTCDGLPDFSEWFTTKVGIIGAHCSELKSLMNMPDGMMEEEEEKEEEQGRIRTGFSILPNYLSLPAPRSPQNRLSSQSTLLSRRQVEGDCHQSN